MSKSRLNAVNAAALDAQLKQLGVTAVLEAPTTRRAIEFTGAPIFSLAALIPLVLVLMTVTGAVYPAIDLTAGERERGTLEMLIAAPVPRLGLLLAKYAAVLTVALLTALVNLAAMTITVHSTGLADVAVWGRRLVAGWWSARCCCCWRCLRRSFRRSCSPSPATPAASKKRRRTSFR